MLAAPARLDSPGGIVVLPAYEMRVCLKRGQSPSFGFEQGNFFEIRARCVLSRGRARNLGDFGGLGQLLNELDERPFELATYGRIRAVFEQIVLVEQAIEAIKANMALRIRLTYFRRHFYAEPERRVHRYADADEFRIRYFLLGEILRRHVHRPGLKARFAQKSQGRGDGNGLVSQLVAGDENDGAG